MIRNALLLPLLCVGLLDAQAATAVTSGPQWSTEVIETDIGRGRGPSVALDAQGTPHVLYYDRNSGSQYKLRYAFRDNGVWQQQTLLSTTGGGSISEIQIDSQGQLHAVLGTLDSGINTMAYARLTGSGWQIDPIPTTGYNPSNPELALDANDQPHVMSYHTSGSFDTGTYYWTNGGGSWTVDPVDVSSNNPSNVGMFGQDILVQADGTITVVGRKDNAVYAFTEDAGNWSSQFVAAGFSFGLEAEPDPAGSFAVGFSKTSDDSLNFSTPQNGGWQTDSLLSLGPAAMPPDVEYGPNGRPRMLVEISLPNSQFDEVNYAEFDGTQWDFNPISSDQTIQSTPDLFVAGDGTLHAVYWDKDDRIVYATAIPEPTSLALLGLGGLAVTRTRRRRGTNNTY